MRRDTITISKEVDIEIDLSDVLDEFSLDQLLQNTSADEVLESYETYEVIDWAVSNLDISELLDGIKNSVNADDMTDWLRSNKDMVPTKGEDDEEEEKEEPKPKPLFKPSVSMNHNKVFVALREEELAPVTLTEVGTYTTFGGVIAVTALDVEFMTTTVQSASAILNALAFTQANLSKEV